MITKNVPLLIGLIAGIIYAMYTGQILISVGVTLATITFVAVIQYSYKKIAKKLLMKNLEVAQSKESPKYDDENNGYYIVELKAKKGKWLYTLFFRIAKFEVFTRVKFQGEKGDYYDCPADEISLGLDRPRRLFIVSYDTVAKLNIVKRKDFVSRSLKETDFCGKELKGNWSLTILVCIKEKKIELPCPLCIKEGEVSGQP